MSDVEIRIASIHDINLLKEIGKKTFFETFSSGNSEENMIQYLEDRFSEKQLTMELANPDSSFYFAIAGEEAVGYLKVNFGKAQTELKDNKAVEIERIYVLRDFQGRKVGQLLYDEAIKVARASKAEYIWLGVWEKNSRAISFYKKNDFVEFDKHIFKLGDDEQTDIMMKLVL